MLMLTGDTTYTVLHLCLHFAVVLWHLFVCIFTKWFGFSLITLAFEMLIGIIMYSKHN